jgi:hypothetical protein
MSENSKSNGLGLGTVLFLIFLTLKLGGWGVVATWSWWWVTSPLWIPLAMIVFFLVLAMVISKLRD